MDEILNKILEDNFAQFKSSNEIAVERAVITRKEMIKFILYLLSKNDNQTQTEEKQQICLECDNIATWVRCTQFSGTHPYCSEHAAMEDDFMFEDSYLYWSKV